MKIEKKHVQGFVFGAVVTAALTFIPILKAQSSSSLSGQYGCIVNKNFAGYDLYLNDSDNVGYNYMFYLDFTNNAAQIAVHLISNYNQSNVSPTFRSVSNGALAVVSGSLTNSHKVTATFTDGGQSMAVTLNAMSVNSGNTLLVSSGVGGNGDSTPFNGVCSKV